MKTKIFTLFFALVAGFGTILASDTQVDGIWYDFHDNNTASVTYAGSIWYEYANEYSGDISIPATVVYNNNVTYTVTSIGDFAFSGCTGLTSVTIPNSVTSIGDFAFSGCSGLTSVTIPNSVTSIGDFAFSGCSGLTSVVIGNGVTSIGEDAFGSCTSLTTVTIPSSVTSIGLQVFYGCSNLSSIEVSTNNSNYCSIDGVLFSKDESTLVEYPCGKKGEYTIPSSVTSIGNYAFPSCAGLTSVTIPNSVTNIGELAFLNCTGLTSVTIPSSVISIGYLAFYGCSSLISITCEAVIPPALNSGIIEEFSFFLKYIYVPAESVNDYKTDVNWSTYAYLIKAIPSGETAVENIFVDTNAVKRIINGQIIILRGKKVFTLTGQEVK